MNSIELILTIISILGVISSIFFAYLAFKRADKKENLQAGKNEGILISDLGYIKSSTERIEKRLDKLDKSYTDLHTRVVILESDVKNISKRRTNRTEANHE